MASIIMLLTFTLQPGAGCEAEAGSLLSAAAADTYGAVSPFVSPRRVSQHGGDRD